MKYGKLVNRQLQYAPASLTINGKMHYHPSDKTYRKLNYLPIIDTPYPEVDEENPLYYASQWVEKDGEIVKKWYEAQAPAKSAPIPSIEDRLIAIEIQQKDAAEQLLATMGAVDFLIMKEV